MRSTVFSVLVAMAALLAGCDGGSVYGAEGSADPTTPTPGGTTPTPVVRLGSFSGSTFNPGVISITPTATLSAGNSTTLTVSLVDTNNSNSPVLNAGNVTFTSSCISQGDSTISENPADISTGNVTVNYTYTGASCGTPDVVTATVVAGGQALTANGSITVTPSPATAIEFVSATPTNIGLQGSGQPSTSQVLFTVKNAAGGPVEGQTVNFTLSTTAGGITMTATSAVTGANGQVSTIVQSGTVPTSVSVTAALVDNPSTAFNESTVPTARSSSLVISTGLADQDSLSLSVGCFNIEGDEYDGTTTSINIIASDRFNNPVPDGTPISFRTEGGSVQPSCFTSGGACSVTFTSSNPRLSDHRSTLVAYAVGEESFNDANGDGRHDAGEQNLATQDLSDAFVDADENGLFSGAAGDVLIDFDGDNAFDSPSGNFTGPLCDSGCDSQTSLYARRSTIIIMSGSTASFTFSPSRFADADADGVFEPADGDYVDLSFGSVAVVVAVGDDADQPMPGNTSIVGTLTGGVGTITGTSTFTQLCTTANSPTNYTFVLKEPTSTTDLSGTFNVTVTTPRGNITEAAVPVRFFANPPPPPPPPAGLGSIRFVSASPSTIGIQGTGLGETSTVIFQVLSETGGVVAGETVNFELSTTVGGLSINPASAVSDSSGFARTIVRSGTVHTSVRVTARSTSNGPSGTPVTAQSDSLTVTTGFPDQNSFSLSIGCSNLEALDIDNVTTSINLLAADRFNNPVADGTAVAFTTEGGSVVGSCQTGGGACSVTWRSQDPRPPDGRSTLLATAIGEESFTDVNGDGIHQAGEQAPSEDYPEAFRDDNESGARDGSEEFLDFNNNGAYDGASGNFTGVLCDTGCDSATKLHVRDSVLIIMSGSSPVIDLATEVACSGCTSYNSATRTFNVADNAFVVLSFVVRDVNDQPMPQGTAVLVTAAGAAGAFVGTTSYSKPCTTDDSVPGNTYEFSFDAANLAAGANESGVIELKVTVPSGLTTVFPFTVNTGPGV